MLGREGQLKLKSLGFYLWLSQNSGPDFCNEHWFSKKVRLYPILFYIYIYISNCNYDATVFEHDPQCISRLVNS